jgi:hypothetical protein
MLQKLFVLALLFSLCLMAQTISYCNATKGGTDCLLNTFNSPSDFEIKCYGNKTLSSLILFPARQIWFDQLFKTTCRLKSLKMSNFGGFQINAALLDYKNTKIDYYIYNSHFKLNPNGEQAFFQLNLTSSNIFLSSDIRYYLNTPSLAFKNSSIKFLSFSGLINSSLVVNYFTFTNEQTNLTDLNSQIFNMELNVFKLTLNERTLDINVFKCMKWLIINDYVEEIADRTFENFLELEKLQFSIYSIKKLINKGIKWMKHLNANVKVNRSNISKPENRKQVIVSFSNSNFYQIKTISNLKGYSYPNEDFCIFAGFPHENNVFLLPDLCYNTCTFYWLTQYSKLFNLSFYFLCERPSENVINECNFSQRLSRCKILSSNKISSQDNLDYDFYYLFDENYQLKYFDYLFSVVLFPVVCLFGVFLNLLNILTIRNRHMKNELKDRMYKQMHINSVIGLITCAINLSSLTIKCIDPITSFCLSSFITNKTYRYFILILTNIFGNVFNTCSNLIHVSIALDRYIKASGTKLRLLKIFSECNLKLLFVCEFVFSFLINTVKFFKYEPDIRYNDFLFPKVFNKYYNFQFMFAFFNVAHIVLSDICLMLIQTCIDLFLLAFLHHSAQKKNLILNNSSSKNAQNLSNKKSINKNTNNNSKAERKVRLMIVISGTLTTLTRLPDLIISIVMASSYKEILHSSQSSDTVFFFIYDNISHFIFFLGFSFDFFLFYSFNRNFRLSFKNLFVFESKQLHSTNK